MEKIEENNNPPPPTLDEIKKVEGIIKRNGVVYTYKELTSGQRSFIPKRYGPKGRVTAKELIRVANLGAGRIRRETDDLPIDDTWKPDEVLRKLGLLDPEPVQNNS